MKNIKALSLCLVLLPMAGWSQTSVPSGSAPVVSPKVTLRAKGEDVRSVLANLFEQAKKQYVLPSNVHYALFLSVENMDFDRALGLVCEQANLSFEIQDELYRVRNAPKKSASPNPPKPAVPDEGEVTATLTAPMPDPTLALAGKKALTRKVTTRLTKADLRKVLALLSEQAEVPIDIESNVPGYKVDAFLLNTSLKYALDRITKAASLDYRVTETGTILVSRKQ